MRQPLVDVNVLLDVLSQREPHHVSSSRIWTSAERRQIRALVSADTFSTLYYLLRRVSDARAAQRGLRMVLDVFDVVGMDEKTIRQALDSPVRDFEDAIRYQSAIHGQADCIITRDLKHYRQADLPVLTPEEFLAAMES
ncbi:MAG: PIN domain-containing protein [Phycisphaeraceae bacterium]|nr:PIN domain-containing protein [Phycisphaeraceae bacterium]